MPKNNITITTENKVAVTHADVGGTWADWQRLRITWANIRLVFSKESKNSISVSNESKNQLSVANDAKPTGETVTWDEAVFRFEEGAFPWTAIGLPINKESKNTLNISNE